MISQKISSHGPQFHNLGTYTDCGYVTGFTH